MKHPFFKDKKILLIEATNKNKNDRTWCFWETRAGLFHEIVYKEWKGIDFYSNSFSGRWDIAPYVYKMIRGKDLYDYVLGQLSRHPNIRFLNEKVERVYSENNVGCVQTNSQLFTAQYVFNSILYHPEQLQTSISLLQHFKGWMVHTKEDVFDSNIATFMDYRIAGTEGNTFVYVLPITEKKALIEYTVFSSSLLKEEDYNKGLQTYISRFLKIADFTVEEEEFGIIPMSNFAFTRQSSPVINIGTAGGQTKGSSGYTFQFIQKHSDVIRDALVNGIYPGKGENVFNRRFKLYDDTLLQVLHSKKLTAAQVFSDLFRRNKPQLIFKFLDNETSLSEEIKIMSSVPSHVFLPAAGKQLLRF